MRSCGKRVAPLPSGRAGKARVGQRTSARRGTAVVRRKGLLDEIRHVPLIREVVIVRMGDAARFLAWVRRALGVPGHRG